MRVTFEIPGKPFAKQRPRFSRKSGRAYTPKATESYESLVRAVALPLFPKPLIGPVIVEIIAIFEPAASWSKAKRETALYQPHTQRPDRDNIEKAILDGLNRVAFADDAQVFDGRTTKRWGPVGDCRLILGDCLEVMPLLGKVDAVVTDPPYGVNYEGSTTKHGKNGFAYASFNDTPEEIRRVCVPAIRLAVSLARSSIVTPGNANAHQYDVPRAMGAIFYPSGANAGPWGFVCSQPLFYYGKDPFLAKGLGSRPNGFSTTESTDRGIGHPCPKPIGQARWMVSRVSFDSETVLDPFMGSGTTLVACAKLGRKGIGIELDPDYFEIACRRVEEAYRQPDLFIEPPKSARQEVMAFTTEGKA